MATSSSERQAHARDDGVAGGPLHTQQQQQFYFHDTTVSMLSVVPALTADTARDTIIVFPDAGAEKRFRAYFPEHMTIACEKERDGERRIIKLPKTPAVRDRETLIVDDLTRSGGTRTPSPRRRTSRPFDGTPPWPA